MPVIGFWAYVATVREMWPYFRMLLDLFVKTPAEKRAEFMRKIAEGIDHAHQTHGDTSKLEDLIRGGK